MLSNKEFKKIIEKSKAVVSKKSKVVQACTSTVLAQIAFSTVLVQVLTQALY